MPNKIRIVLGFDFGMSFIGVAVGQTLTQSASPLTTLRARDGIPNWGDIAKLIEQWQADALVVGIPYNLDGSEQNISHAARKFGHRLTQRFKLPIYFNDERLTTKEARRYSKPGERSDAIAAQLILLSWLQQAKEQNSEKN